ncbi:MAG: SPOR domain-containing protein, partial [Candidatus Marithrix sp.]|nr:SPOR domain-containing protein [Candidatus Marithrix sp.]
MPSRNIRRTHNISAEQYDLKQRIVGGIVLFLMVLIIYGVLKLLLVFSTPDDFEINNVLEFKNFDIENVTNSNDMVSLSDSGNKPQANKVNPIFSANIPDKFVFLDLRGNTTQLENTSTASKAVPSNLYSSIGEERWYVQVASFKDRSRAQRLVNQIKANNIASEVHIIPTGKWFAVRLPPQADRNTAQQQKNRLRRVLKVRPKVTK